MKVVSSIYPVHIISSAATSTNPVPVLTGVSLEPDDLFVPAVGEDAQQRLGRQTHQVLLLQRHGRVDPDVAALARVSDTCRRGSGGVSISAIMTGGEVVKIGHGEGYAV